MSAIIHAHALPLALINSCLAGLRLAGLVVAQPDEHAGDLCPRSDMELEPCEGGLELATREASRFKQSMIMRL
ncbi:hypothetical protein H0G86_000651 [Trichoderma simmonsii]|uniref:Uncharacterized protein n=1 Tax=Trichoderma simmonsii TaxID=1491479 RepID=A0A8G0L344_9HYPO|nr:hypothetical protein H0G86_000651 [Trichoderma simmonsii]